MDIEFIICWGDGTWTTEKKLIADPPLDDKGELDLSECASDYADQLCIDLASTDDIKPCPRGSVVHVGIYLSHWRTRR